MINSEEIALTIEYLQNLQDEPRREWEMNHRRSTFYKVKKFIRVWANRYYFSLVPVSEDPRWIPGNYNTITYCKTPPIAMIVLAILALIVYQIDDWNGFLDNTRNPNSLAHLLVYDPHRRYQFWRYITPMLVHTEFSHLGANLISQIRFGIQLEVAHKPWRVLPVYLTGVLAGTLASSITSSESRLAGASAGVFSLLTFHSVSVIVQWSELEAPAVKLILNVTLMVYSIISSLYNRFGLNITTISDSAHIGGAMTGLLLGIFILRDFQPTKKKTIIAWCCLVACLISIGVAIGWHLFYPDYFPEQF